MSSTTEPQLPKKYKAAIYDKPGSISTKIEELDMPEPGPGQVLINLYVWISPVLSSSPIPFSPIPQMNTHT